MENKEKIQDRINKLIDKIEQIVVSQTGEDYHRYTSVFLKYPDGSSINYLIEKKYDYDDDIMWEPKDYSRYPICFSCNKKGFNYYGEDERRRQILIDSKNLTDEGYEFISKLLDQLENGNLTYDKERTREQCRKAVDFYRQELLNRCKELGLEMVSQYPYIQVTATYWSLVLADYLLSRGYDITEEDNISRIESFRRNLSYGIQNELLINGTNTTIDYGMDILNYRFFNSSHSILSHALETANISLDDFESYCNNENDIAKISTGLDHNGLIRKNTYQMIVIPNEIRKELDYWSYKLITYARSNNIVPDLRAFPGKYLFFTPIIEEVLESGKDIIIDEKELYDMIYQPDNPKDYYRNDNYPDNLVEALRGKFASKEKSSQKKIGTIRRNKD